MVLRSSEVVSLTVGFSVQDSGWMEVSVRSVQVSAILFFFPGT
jgi:hypothetical protein